MDIRIRIKEFRHIPVAELSPHPMNWRTHPKVQRDALKGALAELGYTDVLKVRPHNGGYQILDGHLRAETTPDMDVPCVVLDLDDAESKKMLVTHDPMTSLAETDEDNLRELVAAFETESESLQELVDGLAEGAGIAVEEEPPDDPAPQIDKAAELQEKWGTELGQVWVIEGKAGEHQLVCGDAEEWIAKQPDSSVDMVFTDPPYGHNNNNNGDLIARWEAALGRGEYKPGETDRPIANDGPEANELVRMLFQEASRVLRPGCCCCCCCCGGGPDPQFARWSLWLDEQIPFKMCVVWDKGGLGMGWHYRRCWECILVAQKQGAACNWHGGNDVPNVIRDVGKIIPSADQHPTEKPPELARWFVKLHTSEGQLVIDPFLGSGTTMVAAEQLGRVCYGIEIEPKYVAVSVQRMADMGLTPRLSNG